MRSQQDEEILGRLDFQAEYRSLGLEVLGQHADAKGWLVARAWGREDKDPSASINVKSGRYKDHGGEGQNLGFWDFCAHIGKFPDWRAARMHFADRLGISLETKKRDPKPDDHLVFGDWVAMHVGLWARRKAPVTAESVHAAGGRLARYRKDYHVIALPVFGGTIRDADPQPVGFTLFNTTGGDLPVFSKGDKTPRWKKVKTTRGSMGGLLGGLDALRRLTADPPPDRVWLVEGPTDMLALWSAMPSEARAREIVLANSQGAGEQLRPAVVDLFKGHFVNVVGDCDQPGQLGALKRSEQLARVAGTASLVKLPYETALNHGKDLRDFFNDGHTYAELVDLAGHATPIAPADCAEAEEWEDDPHRLARVFLKAHDQWRFWREEWWRWTGRCYRRVLPTELDAAITASIKAEFDRLYADEKLLAAPEDNKPLRARKVCRSLVHNVVGALAGMRLVDGLIEMPAWLDKQGAQDMHLQWPAEEILAHVGGLLHVPTMLVGKAGDSFESPHSPQFFTANAVDYHYDARRECPAWHEFLDGLWPQDPQAVDTLQEWFGYCLLPDTKHHKIFVLIGPPRSGKGTISRILTKLVGDANVVNPTLGSFEESFGLAPLVGKSVAIITDARLGGRSDEARIVERLLSISGEDAQTIDRKFLSSVTTRLRTRFMILSNELPSLKDASGALASRLVILQTTESFLGREDKTLETRLTREMPGILNWAALGYERLSRVGSFTGSSESDDVIDEYRRMTSPVSAFVSDCCLLARAHQEDADALWERFQKWCEGEGKEARDRMRFGRDLRAAVPYLKRFRVTSPTGRRSYYYTGLRLA